MAVIGPLRANGVFEVVDVLAYLIPPPLIFLASGGSA